MKTFLLLLFVAFISLSIDTLAQTNAVALPVVDQVESWLTVAQNVLSGALAVIVALLGVWGKRKSNKATESGTIANVLIHEIQKVATKEFKDNIASAARDAGVSDSLHAAVKANTASGPAATKPVNPTPIQP